MDKKEYLNIIKNYCNTDNFYYWKQYEVMQGVIEDNKNNEYVANTLDEIMEGWIWQLGEEVTFFVNIKEGVDEMFGDFLINYLPADLNVEVFNEPFAYRLNDVSIFEEEFIKEVEKELAKC